MLNIENLTLHYGNSQILHDVSMTADLGAVTCVMGTNGVGKTSLLKAISGTHPRSGGTVMLDGQDVGHPPAYDLAKMGVGYVPQGRDIFPLMTVRENLQTGFACLPKSEHFIPDDIFDLFPVLKKMENRRGGDLSGGQQQQLAIARALMLEPKILLLDEPTSALDPEMIKEVLDTMIELAEEGMTMLCVTHEMGFARQVANRVIFMDQGQIVEQNEPEAFFNNPQSERTQLFLSQILGH